MPKPEGRLSPAQYEILEAIWEVGPPGASGLQVWERISERRKVVRTTVVNLITRLEARGWLKRVDGDDAIRFWPTLPQEQVEAMVTQDFVESFFGGSTSQLILSLLGRQKITPEEFDQVKNAYEEQRKVTKKQSSRKKRNR